MDMMKMMTNCYCLIVFGAIQQPEVRINISMSNGGPCLCVVPVWIYYAADDI